ncbi:MAG: SIR2 family protein, partial [Campylobacteraceae bacterium]|nr:SIR2 family protein [Campylobacteraceae bacterium]
GKCEPIDILGLIEKDKNIDRSKVINFAKEFYSLSKDNGYELHEKLFQISKKIVTTNYDDAFENAMPSIRTNVATIGEDYELASLNNQNKLTLLKLHGCICRGNSMVILPSDYNVLYERSSEHTERIIFYLRNLIANKTILFIGCSMGDFQVNKIFLDVKRVLGKYDTRKHFIIARELDSKLSDFLELIKIDNYHDAKQIIEAILAKKKELERENPNTRQLEQELDKLKNEISSEDNRIKLLSLQYLIEAIKYHLDKDYEKAIDRYEISTKIDNESNAAAFYTWGSALYGLAKLKNDEKLYFESFRKYEKAIELNPNYAVAFNNWGIVLCKLVKSEKDKIAFKEKFEEYLLAYKKMENAHCYNISCIYALLKDKKSALFYLKQSLERKEIDIDYVINDEDWKEHLEDEEFRELIDRYR